MHIRMTANLGVSGAGLRRDACVLCKRVCAASRSAHSVGLMPALQMRCRGLQHSAIHSQGLPVWRCMAGRR